MFSHTALIVKEPNLRYAKLTAARFMRQLTYSSLLLFLTCPALGQGTNTANKQVTSLGTELQQPGNEPLHILYIHGIGATGLGDSEPLRKSICKFAMQYLHQKCTTTDGEYKGREYADAGIFDVNSQPPALDYMGSPAWPSAEQWHAAAPFVDHYVIALTGEKSILVDEINWWPLVFSVKCQHIMPNETNLAGALTGKDDNFLSICTKQQTIPGDSVPGRFDTYNWLAAAGLDATTLNGMQKNAVIINRWAKDQIMDWSFSDALLSVGPLEGYLVEGIRQVLVKCVDKGTAETAALTSRQFTSADPNARFITISHSLGSFLIFSALHAEYIPNGVKFNSDKDEEVRTKVFDYLLGRLSQAYFFANQIPLLELSKMSAPNEKSFLDLSAWSRARRQTLGIGNAVPSQPLGQIVSWSDANDLLTWYLGDDFTNWQAPSQNDIRVVNKLVKNATTWNWLGLLENPELAHGNYATNPAVIRSLLQSPQ
jgi:hypothetical protein